MSLDSNEQCWQAIVKPWSTLITKSNIWKHLLLNQGDTRAPLNYFQLLIGIVGYWAPFAFLVSRWGGTDLTEDCAVGVTISPFPFGPVLLAIYMLALVPKRGLFWFHTCLVLPHAIPELLGAVLTATIHPRIQCWKHCSNARILLQVEIQLWVPDLLVCVCVWNFWTLNSGYFMWWGQWSVFLSATHWHTIETPLKHYCGFTLKQ